MASYTDYCVKGLVESYSESYRAKLAIPERDVRIVILRAGAPDALTEDDQVTFGGVRYALAFIGSDATASTWTARGKPL